MMDLEIRPAEIADLPRLERKCWRGGEDEMLRRIGSQGTCSILALERGRPVAQLYLRTWERGFRSPAGMMDGAWWADLKGVEKRVELPARTVMLGCWHVGRVREEDESEREAPEYRGRGVGIALARGAIAWLEQTTTTFEALAVKALDSQDRSYMEFVGGLPRGAFESLGFSQLVTFDDPYFMEALDRIPESAVAEHPARFHLMVFRRPG
jgi:hypothetical protein